MEETKQEQPEEEMDIDADAILEMSEVEEQEGDGSDEIDTVTFEALNAARKAFYDVLEKYSFDGIYWDLEIHAHQLSMDLMRMVKFSIEDVEAPQE